MSGYPVVTIIGCDTSKTPPTEFHNAVVLTDLVVSNSTVEFKLKNSIKGEHLEGHFDLGKNDFPIKLKKTKVIDMNVSWKMMNTRVWCLNFR